MKVYGSRTGCHLAGATLVHLEEFPCRSITAIPRKQDRTFENVVVSLLRYSVYFAVALAVLLVAVGIGAAAAVMVGWQSGAGTGNSAETSTPEGGKTDATRAAKDSAPESPSDSENPSDSSPLASFVHRATDGNSRGDYTVVSDPSLNGHPNAILLASLPSDREDAETASYDRNIGVWYAGNAQRWAIFNQDRSPIPAGTTFEVVVPQETAGFIHRADLVNTVENYTYLDNQLTNGNPDAVLSVTQNWNPGGGAGVYNDHPIEATYDENLKQWAIVNRDGGAIPKRAAFNVAVSEGTN
jgi:hypothetical protein